MVIICLSYLNAFLFAAIAAFHYYWALGGRFGFNAVLPETPAGAKAFVPGRGATAVVATLFLLVALFYLRIPPLPALAYRYIFWLITLVTLARAVGDFRYVGFFKKPANNRFASNDSRYYSPLCLYLGLSTLLMAWSIPL